MNLNFKLLSLLLVSLQSCVDGKYKAGKPGAENQVIRATISRMSRYYEGRTAVGKEPMYPFLCYSLLSKQTEFPILLRNIAVFGTRCEWALTFNVAEGIAVDEKLLSSVAKAHKTKIVQMKSLNIGPLIKTILWKQVILSKHQSYSHMWMIDADIEFSTEQLDRYLYAWRCGSVAGSPPLISQPTVKPGPGAEPQDYLEVNHDDNYESSGLSAIGSDIIENQIVLADMGFLFWYYREVISPYFEKIKSFNESDWGLSRTWCKGAVEYKKIHRHWSKGTGVDIVSGTPLGCAILPHPVVHLSTHGIKKTRGFIHTGRYNIIALRHIFPVWSVDRKVDWNSTEIIALRRRGDNSARQNSSHMPRVVEMTGPIVARRRVKNACSQVVSVLHNGSRIFFWK